jgi:hypothetical protein
VRYELDLYILFRRNFVFKGLIMVYKYKIKKNCEDRGICYIYHSQMLKEQSYLASIAQKHLDFSGNQRLGPLTLSHLVPP